MSCTTCLFNRNNDCWNPDGPDIDPSYECLHKTTAADVALFAAEEAFRR